MKASLPTVDEVARTLHALNNFFDEETDVRLCVWADGAWHIKTGDVQYDTEHADFCEAGSIPGIGCGEAGQFDARELARELLSGCEEQEAMADDGDL